MNINIENCFTTLKILKECLFICVSRASHGYNTSYYNKEKENKDEIGV